MINGYIDVNTRTGALDANVNSCAKETIVFNVSFDVGLTVAILNVEGKTLALSKIEEATPYSVTINTATVQAYELTRELGAGQSLPIVIAIGESNHLQALVTGRMQFNSLYDKAPPIELAPQYPTSAELQDYLNAMLEARAGIDTVVNDAKKSLCDTIDAFTAETNETITDWCADVAATKKELNSTISSAKNDLDSSVESATQSLNTVVANANTALNSTIDTAKNDINNTINDAKQDFDAAVEDVKHIADNKADKAYVDEQCARITTVERCVSDNTCCIVGLSNSLDGLNNSLNRHIDTRAKADMYGHIKLASCYFVSPGYSGSNYALLQMLDRSYHHDDGQPVVPAATCGGFGVVKIGNYNDENSYWDCYTVAPMLCTACCIQAVTIWVDCNFQPILSSQPFDNCCLVTYGTLVISDAGEENTIAVPLCGVYRENYYSSFNSAAPYLGCSSYCSELTQSVVTPYALLRTLACNVFAQADSCVSTLTSLHSGSYSGVPVYIEDISSMYDAQQCLGNDGKAAFVPAGGPNTPGVGYVMTASYLDCGILANEFNNGIPVLPTVTAVRCLIQLCAGGGSSGESDYLHYYTNTSALAIPTPINDVFAQKSVTIGVDSCATGCESVVVGSYSTSGERGIVLGVCSSSKNGIAIGTGLRLNQPNVGMMRFFYDRCATGDVPAIGGMYSSVTNEAYIVFGRGSNSHMCNGIAIKMDTFIQWLSGIFCGTTGDYRTITEVPYADLC